ncbi:hypothetical protein SCHPADRAFT_901991 [Schizopora paradoxa]|uniref:GAR domain-containing protein n=1 Tax=Schizopora paradoxa TaxID=27342 RepID=A0A0H2RVL6_9AGAM|nr:hypothetical protein SCHPADRAFT_901991 [Schizopora paradoxa]
MSESASAPCAPGELNIPASSTSATLVHDELGDTTEVEDVHTSSKGNLEESLETHEVVELQSFLRRKEWIDEKIQFLESLPSIDIFVDADDLTNVVGLPSRSQLEDWIIEHDRIEKETEIFDSGDLKKLKSLTKAATQRNLSPEDTDLVELTLTTLFALDRLLHLLRDRSEKLDLLGLRLTWEEHRTAAVTSRNDILSDLQKFLANSARWSPSVYAAISDDLDALAFDSLPETSRADRFRLAEAMSMDAAQFSSRITHLRHGPVASSGKALDKLIDDSRTPVPDALLDEQDRIEDTCSNELEHIGKFTLSAVMQWKRADDIYIETKRDRCSTTTLIKDLNQALAQHPSRKMDTNLRARLDTLESRLSARVDPKLHPGSFPQPTHPLFPDQEQFNSSLTDSLSNEVRSTRDLLVQASKLASQNRRRCDAVETAESLLTDLTDHQARLQSIKERLVSGFNADDGDGSPPDLAELSCVEPMRFSAYLAMLPSSLEEYTRTSESTKVTLKKCRFALVELKNLGIVDDYRRAFLKAMESTDQSLKGVEETKDHTNRRVTTLREVRRIWSNMNDTSARLEITGEELKESLAKHRWKQQSHHDDRPLTPESPLQVPHLPSTNAERVDEDLARFESTILADIRKPLGEVRTSVPPNLCDALDSRLANIARSVEVLHAMKNFLDNVIKQASAMEGVQNEMHALELRIEDISAHYDEVFRKMLSDSIAVDVIDTTELELAQSVENLQKDVDTFVDSLATRVPLIATPDGNIATSVEGVEGSFATRFPFDPSSVDRMVRNDANQYSMRLGGSMKSVRRKKDLFGFYKAAREVDTQLGEVHLHMKDLDGTHENNAAALRQLSPNRPDEGSERLANLRNLKASYENASKPKVATIDESISSIRAVVGKMRSYPNIQDDVALVNLLTRRASSLDELDLQNHRLQTRVNGLHGELNAAEQTEVLRLAELERSRQLEESRALHEAQMASSSKATEPVQKVSEHGGLHSEDDVFGSSARSSMDRDSADLISRIRTLRKRLNLIGFHAVVRPGSKSHGLASSLPTLDRADAMESDFAELEDEVKELPESPDSSALAELLSLKEEMRASRMLLSRVKQLAKFSSAIVLCDNTFSDFLDHIDNFSPTASSSSKSISKRHTSSLLASAEDELSERLSYAKGIMGDMNEHFEPVADDSRASSEHNRLCRTWEELREMALEKINGNSSRPGSVNAASSGRNSSLSASSSQVTDKKRSKYGVLSLAGKNRPKLPLLAPSVPSSQRRSVSNVSTKSQQAKSSQSLSIASPAQRSVSGPGPMSPPTHSSLHHTTFASRQRTTSTSSVASSIMSLNRRPSGTPTPLASRRLSTASESRPVRSSMDSPSVSSTRGTWSRAPRQSFGTVPRSTTPHGKPSNLRKQHYVANPANKLDMAVGDVVNNLPVDINVEVVADTWRDKSGKYWIGGSEPKLCFCRILRSQTVMVRVGGGWAELSKFIKDHFADLFRLMPESPPRPGTRDEKWISSSSLRRTSEEHTTPEKRSTRSPEPPVPPLPAFAISTPDGSSNQAMLSTSSVGSPLTPLQFMRRADAEPSEFSLSATPSRGSLSTRSKVSIPNTPSKSAVWRP